MIVEQSEPRNGHTGRGGPESPPKERPTTRSGSVDLAEAFAPLPEAAVSIRATPFAALRVTLPDGEIAEPVHAALAFPLQSPARYVVLYDADRREIGLIEDPARLDPESRAALATELSRAYCIPIITRVESVRYDGAVAVWHVETDRGPRRFELNGRRDARFLEGGRVLIKDSDGNRYDIPDCAALDARSRAIVEREV